MFREQREDTKRNFLQNKIQYQNIIPFIFSM